MLQGAAKHGDGAQFGALSPEACVLKPQRCERCNAAECPEQQCKRSLYTEPVPLWMRCTSQHLRCTIQTEDCARVAQNLQLSCPMSLRCLLGAVCQVGIGADQQHGAAATEGGLPAESPLSTNPTVAIHQQQQLRAMDLVSTAPRSKLCMCARLGTCARPGMS